MFGLFGSARKRKVALAAQLAGDELLGGKFDHQVVKNKAIELSAGSSQSAETLATQAALWFFRNPGDLRSELFETQLMARMKVLEWHQESKISAMLALAFENALYKDYRPKF